MKSRISLLVFFAIVLTGAADAATTNFFDSCQTSTLVETGITSDIIRSNGYEFTYTRDKLFGGGTGRPVRVPWPEGVEAQALTVAPVGKAQITISRADGTVFDIPAFTAKLLANTVGAGGAIEVMPQLNGEDGYNDPVSFRATGNTNQTFSYDTNTTPQSTSLLSGFDTYKISLYVDFALTAITLVDDSIPPITPPVEIFTVRVSDTSGTAIAGADVAVDHPGAAPQTTDADGQATFCLPTGGTYLYTIQAAGYVKQEFSSDQPVVDVTLAEIDVSISISGIVEDTGGSPLVGATVTAFQPDDIAVTYQALTGAGGAYTLNLPTGALNSGYTVVAKMEGFVSVEQINQAAGIVDFTGSTGLQAKTTITSVTGTLAGNGVRLDITADPAFTSFTEADVTVTSGSGLLGPLSFADGTISVTYSAVEDFTVVIKADTSEDHNPTVGYFAGSSFSYVADDPGADTARMDVDSGGGTLNLTANGQTATVVVDVSGVTKPATLVIKQIPKTTATSDTEGSPMYVYEVTAINSVTGFPLTAAEINRIELTLPIDLNIVQPGDLEGGVYAIYQAADMAALETGGSTPVPASQIISTDYVGDGVVGSVRFWVDHLSVFGVGDAPAVTPPTDGGGGGGGGGCFITSSAYDSKMKEQIGAIAFPTSLIAIAAILFGSGSSEVGYSDLN